MVETQTASRLGLTVQTPISRPSKAVGNTFRALFTLPLTAAMDSNPVAVRHSFAHEKTVPLPAQSPLEYQEAVLEVLALEWETGCEPTAACLKVGCHSFTANPFSSLNVEIASSFWVMNSSRAGVPACVCPIARVRAGMI